MGANNAVIEIEAGWTVHVRTITIIEGVEVAVYDGETAVLRINEADVIEFTWCEEAETLFTDIDVCEPIELLETVARLNRQLTDGMAPVARKAVV